MVDSRNEIVRNMKQRVRTPQFLNRVIKVYDFTTLFTRLMMYKRAKSSLVQPKKEGEEETMYNMYNSMFIRIKKKNKFNDKKMTRILKRFYNISPTSTVEVMHTCMEYLSSLDGTIRSSVFDGSTATSSHPSSPYWLSSFIPRSRYSLLYSNFFTCTIPLHRICTRNDRRA